MWRFQHRLHTYPWRRQREAQWGVMVRRILYLSSLSRHSCTHSEGETQYNNPKKLAFCALSHCFPFRIGTNNVSPPHILCKHYVATQSPDWAVSPFPVEKPSTSLPDDPSRRPSCNLRCGLLPQTERCFWPPLRKDRQKVSLWNIRQRASDLLNGDARQLVYGYGTKTIVEDQSYPGMDRRHILG